MNKKHFIDIAYTLAKEKFAKKRFTFNSLYELLVKEAKLSNEERKDCIGTMYVELLQDSRFIYTGENLWAIKEFLLQNEIAKYNNSLYNLKIEVDEGEINNQDDEDEITSLDNENDEEDEDEISDESKSDNENSEEQ